MEHVVITVPPLTLQVRPKESDGEQPINIPLDETEEASGEEEQVQEEQENNVEIDFESLREAVDQAFDLQQTRLAIEFSEEANRFIYRFIDRNTGEIIKELPQEEVINQIAKFREIAGLVLDAQT